MSLTINDAWHGEMLVVSLAGRLDTQTSKVFEDHLAQHLARRAKTIVVDLTQVAYISSYGLRVFLLTAKKLRADRNAFVLCGLTSDVAKIFQISGFDKILTIRPALADVVASTHGDAQP